MSDPDSDESGYECTEGLSGGCESHYLTFDKKGHLQSEELCISTDHTAYCSGDGYQGCLLELNGNTEADAGTHEALGHLTDKDKICSHCTGDITAQSCNDGSDYKGTEKPCSHTGKTVYKDLI